MSPWPENAGNNSFAGQNMCPEMGLEMCLTRRISVLYAKIQMLSLRISVQHIAKHQIGGGLNLALLN